MIAEDMPTHSSIASPEPSAYVPDAEAVRRFRAEGFLVTPPLFDRPTLARARAEIERIWAIRNTELERSNARGAASKAAFSRARPELPRLHLESPLLSEFCRAPALERLARALLGDDVDLVWNQAYAKSPNGDFRTEIPWHQDGWYAEIDGLTYNCWVAITETTVANGALLRVPKPDDGSLLPHVWDDRLLFFRCDVDESQAVPVELEPGQAFLFTTHVPHRSGVNVTDRGRVSYAISFAHRSARLRANGEAFGDRVPLLRDGRSVTELMDDFARRGGDTSHPAARVVDEIRARAPRRTDETDRHLFDFVRARASDDDEAASAALAQLLAVLPDSDEVLGDLVRARGRTDQLLTELAAVRGTDARIERLLAERVLELEPGQPLATAALAALATR